MNRFKTAILLSFLTLLMVLIGGTTGGQGGMLIAFLMAAAVNLFTYWFSDRMLPMQEARLATAHLFIVNPLTGGGLLSLFSTHPPMEERVARLEAMAGKSGSY